MDDSSLKKPLLKITKDGSHTLYSERFQQHYHNPNGAVAESKHNFFEVNGLMKALHQKGELHILEIGFGTGLNLLLLMDALLDLSSKISVQYSSIEAFPIRAETASSFNFKKHLNHPHVAEKLVDIFSELNPGMNSFTINPNLEVLVFNGFFKDFRADNFKADFIFHDAFSPGVNPNLWTDKVFEKLLTLSKSTAILSTYCAASKARGAMATAGWKVARAQGALGKREMTVASPTARPLKNFKRVNEKRLAKRYEEGDF